ncbi:hypothetical protein BGZ76_011318 [Entomortierella beljakovae]|nr:hypothetical protein BGZ76_011318 [Entomortierella beljakovae]
MSTMVEETPKEMFISSQEILSTIDWADALQNQDAKIEAITLFETHISILLEALTKINAKKFSRFLKDAVMTIARPIKAIHRIKEFIAAEPTTDLAQSIQNDQSVLDAFEEKISSAVSGLVSGVSSLWSDHQVFKLRLSPELDNEINNQHYLLVYLVLLLLDKWVALEEMEASSSYFEYTNPKYRKFSLLGPNSAPPTKNDTKTTLRHMKSMMDNCVKCHLSIESLLVWKPTPGADENDDSYDEEALIEDNYPLSETGITTLVCGMIYAAIRPDQLSSVFTLPLAFAQDWLFSTAGGLASGFLTSDESQLAMADKALLVLLYAVDRTPLNEFKSKDLDYCTPDNSTDRMGLFQIFQVMVSFAATCPSSNHRFYCFQSLDRLIQACADDVKMYLLEQLVSPKCPYESMKAAAINLVKATVERAFVRLDKTRQENMEKIRSDSTDNDPSSLALVNSPFTSPMLLKTFTPSILRFEVKPFEHNPLSNENAWLAKYDTFMHALNFYIFLLMRDSRDDNVTEVWLTSSIQDSHREFIEPLMERVVELKEEYIQRLAQAEIDQDSVFNEDDLGPLTDRIRSKNGVVDFDIDMESEEESNDESDNESNRKKNTKPKDTVADLNSKMMRVEIMDELLERIQELTSSLL